MYGGLFGEDLRLCYRYICIGFWNVIITEPHVYIKMLGEKALSLSLSNPTVSEN